MDLPYSRDKQQAQARTHTEQPLSMHAIHNAKRIGTVALATAALLSCSRADRQRRTGPRTIPTDTSLFETECEIVDRTRPAASPNRNADFGDLHVHTPCSLDASAFGAMKTPCDVSLRGSLKGYCGGVGDEHSDRRTRLGREHPGNALDVLRGVRT